jgi:hypothetical protein
MWVSKTWVIRTPRGNGEAEDAVDVALRVDHERDPAVVDEVAAVAEGGGVDGQDERHGRDSSDSGVGSGVYTPGGI